MDENNMTALVSLYVKIYHNENNKCKIFSDNIGRLLLTDEEYNSISNNMSNNIKFFNSSFTGTKEESLRWIVDNILSPTVLARSAFCESSLINAIKFGCSEYLIYASGYDTFAYRNTISNLKVFEIDKCSMIEDKIYRLNRANIDCSSTTFIKCDFTDNNWITNIINSSYNKNEISFNSLLGLTYYLTKDQFKNMIKDISNIIKSGSTILFDYPTSDDSEESKVISDLASETSQEMKSKYSYNEIEDILSENNLLIYEHLNNIEMTNNYFNIYNTFNINNKIKAISGVSYVLAVKR